MSTSPAQISALSINTHAGEVTRWGTHPKAEYLAHFPVENKAQRRLHIPARRSLLNLPVNCELSFRVSQK